MASNVQRLPVKPATAAQEAADAHAKAVKLAATAANDLLRDMNALAVCARQVAGLSALPAPFCQAAKSISDSLETSAKAMQSALARK